MYTDEFEQSFAAFLESKEYDQAEEALFSMLRRAYAAGWRAAGGSPEQAKGVPDTVTP